MFIFSVTNVIKLEIWFLKDFFSMLMSSEKQNSAESL